MLDQICFSGDWKKQHQAGLPTSFPQTETLCNFVKLSISRPRLALYSFFTQAIVIHFSCVDASSSRPSVLYAHFIHSAGLKLRPADTGWEAERSLDRTQGWNIPLENHVASILLTYCSRWLLPSNTNSHQHNLSLNETTEFHNVI